MTHENEKRYRIYEKIFPAGKPEISLRRNHPADSVFTSSAG